MGSDEYERRAIQAEFCLRAVRIHRLVDYGVGIRDDLLTRELHLVCAEHGLDRPWPSVRDSEIKDDGRKVVVAISWPADFIEIELKVVGRIPATKSIRLDKP